MKYNVSITKGVKVLHQTVIEADTVNSLKELASRWSASIGWGWGGCDWEVWKPYTLNDEERCDPENFAYVKGLSLDEPNGPYLAAIKYEGS